MLNILEYLILYFRLKEKFDAKAKKYDENIDHYQTILVGRIFLILKKITFSYVVKMIYVKMVNVLVTNFTQKL